jgi:hypothetical protein
MVRLLAFLHCELRRQGVKTWRPQTESVMERWEKVKRKAEALALEGEW